MIRLRVNGDEISVRARPGGTLLDLLRTDAGLTGAKQACGRGECGACTVIVNASPVMACLFLIEHADGADVVTSEGLGERGRDLARAFVAEGALQCGYCTPGQIVRASCLQPSSTPLSDATVRHEMSGNICRCTGYSQIVDAIRKVGEQGRETASR